MTEKETARLRYRIERIDADGTHHMTLVDGKAPASMSTIRRGADEMPRGLSAGDTVRYIVVAAKRSWLRGFVQREDSLLRIVRD